MAMNNTAAMQKLRQLLAAKNAGARFEADKKVLNVPPDHDPLAGKTMAQELIDLNKEIKPEEGLVS